jgi:hypothetical protein
MSVDVKNKVDDLLQEFHSFNNQVRRTSKVRRREEIGYLIEISSISKINVAFGPIICPPPFSP